MSAGGMTVDHDPLALLAPQRGTGRANLVDDGGDADPTAAARAVGRGRGRGSGAGARGARRGPARCRICRAALVTAPERTLGRCRTCPTDVDEALLERLRDWRRTEAARRAVPAYVVFTDATLLAVAEQAPTSADQLATISGLGPAKLEWYAEALLALVRGTPPPVPSVAARTTALSSARDTAD